MLHAGICCTHSLASNGILQLKTGHKSICGPTRIKGIHVAQPTSTCFDKLTECLDLYLLEAFFAMLPS